MVKTKTNLLLTIFIVLTIIFNTFSALKFFEQNKKIVYVDNLKIFEKFNMTIEMKKIGDKEFNIQKLRIDSLFSKVQSPLISNDDKELTMQQLIQAKDELEKFNKKFAYEESSKIWIRIKSYSSEFAKENGYNLIIGSENKTNILFADEEIDVTTDLLTYINKKYEGLK
ncbi:OmpH family outer membrane protein [Flavobacterium marginilacus]|uniref:OmpH family outer membrane protein n=1 Tax=Flavobacterium marginilacus TaxID=3003256 RepID=UPI00248DFE3B|nr:OmpH family outer membrane protein [Flavobacterium marginilacus]